MTATGWRTDDLGAPFERRELPLGSDAEGPVVATLVRVAPSFTRGVRRALSSSELSDVDVLYLHGWSDYFFQAEHALWWEKQGARFFALDLRKYGRSLRPGQSPGFVDDLRTYDEDIAAALDVIRAGTSRPRRLVLLGHSTGGLTASLWAARHPGELAALVLNSPWLELQTGGMGREALAPLISVGARIAPTTVLPNIDMGYYARAVGRQGGGEWDVHPEWRPVRGFPVRSAWLAAVVSAHEVVAAGLGLEIPVLTLLSARSTIALSWSEEMRRSDSVLVVENVAARAVKLGGSVTIERLDGALHDVMLSAPEVRQLAYSRISRWARGALAR
ncbi:MAG: alpha/beta hydrolase [Mycetocola sp.]